MHTYRLAVGSWRYRQLPTENRHSSVGVYRTPTRSSGLIGAIPPIRNLNRRKSQSALVGRCVPNVNPIVGANRQVCIEFRLDSTVGGKLTNHSYHFRARLDLAAIIASTGIDYFTHFRHFLLRCFHPTSFNLFPLIPACTARPGLPLSPPETAFLESPYYRPQTASIVDRHRPTNFHSVTYTQTDDAAFEAGSDNDHKSFLRMRVIFKVEHPAELFRFRRVLDDILSSFDVF